MRGASSSELFYAPRPFRKFGSWLADFDSHIKVAGDLLENSEDKTVVILMNEQ